MGRGESILNIATVICSGVSSIVVALAAGAARAEPAPATTAVTAVTPTLTPRGGTYATTQTVTLADRTSGAKIYYTTNDTTPTTKSTLYGGAFKVSAASTTVKAIAVASGYQNSAVASATYVVSLQPPSALSYPTPTVPLLVGKSVTLNPKVTGKVTAYAVSPALPAGISLNKSTGVISGAPKAAEKRANYSIAAANASGTTTFALSLEVDTGPTVHLSAAAADTEGDSIKYRWLTTDGTLLNTAGAATDWLLPPGSGIHFAYVLASNGLGGYTESRVAVNTGTFGSAAVTPPPMAYSAPTQAAPTTVPVRFFMANAPSVPSPATLNVAAAGLSVSLYEDPVVSPLIANQVTDIKGSVTFQNVPVSNNLLSLICSFQGGGGIGCGPQFTASLFAPSNYEVITPGIDGTTAMVPSVVGSVVQSDHTPAGITEPFFGISAPSTVSLTYPNCAAGEACSHATVNTYGDFTVALTNPCAGDLTLTVSSDNATRLTKAIPCTTSTVYDGTSIGLLTLPKTSSPTITKLTATYNGEVVGSLLPKAAAEPSDKIPEQDVFLSFKGTDSRLSACKYYEAIGAVPAGKCGSSGNFQTAINFEDWKRTVQIDGYAVDGATTVTANFVNVVDLNLARGHHSIAYPGRPYGPNSAPTAAYVCNHPGAVDSSGNPLNVNLPASAITPAQQTAVNASVAGSLGGINRIACVAMDYTANDANGGNPYTRFLIFGPSGQLLPSVNLDGRGEKFMPGACLSCHGGDNYAGVYPKDGSGSADVGGHWLPYDVGNFAFSTASGLTDAAQERAIYEMNQNVLSTSPTAATQALITAWYANGLPLNQSYVPSTWETSTNPYATQVYQTVIARSCRTCHSALKNYNWDAAGPDGVGGYYPYVCGGTPNKVFNHSMPNSLITFNRFWNSVGTHNAQGVSTDQPALFASMVNYAFSNPLPSGCLLSQGP